MSKAIGLIRVSTQVQELESQSIKVKEAILRDGYDESDIILIEDKESGSKLSEEERSGLNKLKHTIESEQVSSVYCYELSRISRKASVLYSIRDYLTQRKINLICLNPYFRMLKEDDSFDENSNLFFGIFSSMSENETFLRTRRMMRGKERKKNEGKLSVGKPIFGYTVDSQHYVIPHPKQAPIVREIFERYSQLESSGSIGRDLYRRNALATKSTKEVTVQTYISVILREKRYANLVESIYPPLISKELFLKCQDILSRKPEHFTRKSKVKVCCPLQGYLFTLDGYVLTPSITNNRYLKTVGSSKYRLSLNMTNSHTLAYYVMNKYSQNHIQIIDVEKERVKIQNDIVNLRSQYSGIDSRISLLQKENDMINSRIIKGRLSESKGDALIDENIRIIHSLEDDRQELSYNILNLENRLIYLANPLLSENSQIKKIDTLESLKEFCIKYLKKIIVQRLRYSTYELHFYFLDGFECIYSFYSLSHYVKFYNQDGVEIEIK